MSSKDEERWKLRVMHIKAECANIRAFVQGLNFESFASDTKTIYAVGRSFQIIGEASKLVPDHIRQMYPAVPWREMCQFRDRVVHDYDDIELSLLWQIIVEDLPSVEKAIQQIPLVPEDLE